MKTNLILTLLLFSFFSTISQDKKEQFNTINNISNGAVCVYNASIIGNNNSIVISKKEEISDLKKLLSQSRQFKKYSEEQFKDLGKKIEIVGFPIILLQLLLILMTSTVTLQQKLDIIILIISAIKLIHMTSYQLMNLK